MEASRGSAVDTWGAVAGLPGHHLSVGSYLRTAMSLFNFMGFESQMWHSERSSSDPTLHAENGSHTNTLTQRDKDRERERVRERWMHDSTKRRDYQAHHQVERTPDEGAKSLVSLQGLVTCRLQASRCWTFMAFSCRI